MAIWQNVPPDVATAHPLYGLRGWLRIPSIGFVLLMLGAVMMLWQSEGASPATWTLWTALGLLSVIGVPVAALLWFRRWRLFRLSFLGFAILSNLYEAADVAMQAPSAEDPGGEMALFLIGLALDTAFVAAMQHSQRFRVTFEHRVRATG